AIIDKFITFIADNAHIIAGLVDGEIDLGTLGDVLKSLDVDINELFPKGGFYPMIQDMLVQAVYPDTNSQAYKDALAKVQAKGIDALIYEDMISDLIGKDLLPGFTMDGNTTFDALLKSAFKISWDNYLVKLIANINVDWSTSDNEALKKLGEIMNLNGPTIDTNIPFDESKSFTSQINNIIGYMAVQFFPGYAGKWVNGDASKLGANLNALYLYVAKALGITDGIDTSDSEAVAFAVVKYILANIESESMDAYIEGIDSCKDLKQVAVVVLRNTAKINNITVTSSSKATYENIVGDILTYYVGKYVVLPYDAGAGKDVWTVLNDIVNVFLYDKGFAKVLNMSTTKDKDVFAKLDELIAKTKLFDNLDKDYDYSTKAFLKDGILEAVFSLDLAKVVDITVTRFLSDFGTQKVSAVGYDAVYNLLSGLFGKDILVKRNTASTKPIDDAITNKNLETMIKNLLASLNSKRASLVPAIAYIGALVIGQPVGTSSFSVDSQICLGGETVLPLTAKAVLDGKSYALKLGRDYDVVSITADNYDSGSTVTAKLNFYGYVTTEAEITYKIVLDNVKNLKASSVTTNSAVLTWDAVPGATYYQVVCGKDVIKATTTSCKLTGLASATEYKYSVRAIQGSQRSAYTSVYVLTNPAKASAPTASSITDTSVKLTWKAVTGATGYVVEKYLGSGKWGTVKTVTTTSYVVSGLSAKTAYSFRVKAYKKGTSGTVYGDPSSYIKVTTLIGTPKISASASTYNAIKVAWTKVAGAAGYSLEQYNGSKWVVVKNTTATSYTVSKLKTNTDYNFRVRAYYKSGSKYVFGNYSAVKVSTAPTYSSKVAVAKPTSSTLTVSWKAVTGATAYKVYYSTNNKSWKSVTATKTSVTLTKLTANTKYYIKVQALKKTAGIYAAGPYSATVTAATNVAKVTGLKASSVTKDSVTLTWTKVSGASGYTVYRKNGSKWVKVADVKTNTYTDKKLSRYTSYTYYVAAYKTVSKKPVYGDNSASVTAKTKMF
ncbi:MAG: fibronectin type III domain-containing protein, partial [Acutalibacteraceae bacterium]